MFFRKKRSVIETINDLDGNVVNLFRVIREHPEKLARLIEFTPWSRQEYRMSYELTGNSLEDARRFLVRMWQGIGSKTSDKTGWRNNIQDLNGNVNQWSVKLPARILNVSERFRHTKDGLVQIENQPAVRLIERHRRENVLIYADPPYVLSTRHGRIYKYEMGDADHIELLETLIQHPGPVIISGYQNELYSRMLKGWRTDTKLARCEGGQKREEVIWMNYRQDREASLF
ncbi:DNA adenine methylase [Desulfosporosinus sp. PR]|nr:DNA adenine methylase [Desulfosporosinus sp. PR]MDQ7095966.1 DNA adenine methylase [Desulfosporosinus sp. PR]